MVLVASEARIVKSLHSVGLYGAEVGGIPAQGMTELRASARRALGKGAGLRKFAPLELMAHGGPAADPQLSADLSTARVVERCPQARKRQRSYPQSEANGRSSWLVTRRRRLDLPKPVVLLGRGHSLRAKWSGTLHRSSAPTWLAPKRTLRAWLPVFPLLPTDSSNLMGKAKKKKTEKAALNAALGGVWHEERAHSAFQVGDTCVRCGDAVENLEFTTAHTGTKNA
eukprot:5289636-Amphidinium_carterae.1